MRVALSLALAGAALATGGCTTYGTGSGWSSYDYNRPDPRYNGYYADRYYRAGSDYYVVKRDDRIYRGRDGRYYCRRSDGTTGLVVGAAVGGLFGNLIAPGGSKVLGTLLGAGAGAVAGNAIDKDSDVRCR